MDHHPTDRPTDPPGLQEGMWRQTPGQFRTLYIDAVRHVGFTLRTSPFT